MPTWDVWPDMGQANMRFLSVADRELRSAARQKGTYRVRWVTAALFLALLVWLLWVFNVFGTRRMVPQIFAVFSVLTFLHCLFIASTRTADCISAERREGTLGFLFLTNLNSAEIIAGKLCSSALASIFGLMAIFPMLALPMLMGGITFGNFAHTVLGLLNGILFGLAGGFLASVLCKRQFMAIAVGLGSTVLFACGFMLAAAAANAYTPTRWLVPWLAPLSPLYTIFTANGGRFLGTNLFWQSAALVAGISLAAIGLTTLLLAGSWRDRPENVRTWPALLFRRGSSRTFSPKRIALRRRLLAVNPVFWLAGRKQVSSPFFMVLAVIITTVTAQVAAPFFGVFLRAGTAAPVLGHLFAWLWAGIGIHCLVLYYAAMSASQRLAEDKQAGALELILCTPTTQRTISHGLWLAYARKMLFPALLAVLVHAFFVWLITVMASLDPPGQLAPGAKPGEIFWSALLNRPLRGRPVEWEFCFMFRAVLLILVQLIASWITLGWVGRWLGVRMQHPGFAPLASLALLVAPPVLLFSLSCYLAEKCNFFQVPQRRFLPILMWFGLTIGMGHCLALSIWAATRLRNYLRVVAVSRFQPLPLWRWRLPSRRTVLQVAGAAAGCAALVAALIAGYYKYQNWHARRAWAEFQTSIKQNGVNLELATFLPQPVPDSANFAHSPAFLVLLSRSNTETTGLLQRRTPLPFFSSMGQGSLVLMEWSRQSPFPLYSFPNVSVQNFAMGSAEKRAEDAATVLARLRPEDARLKAIAAAAAQCSFFQLSTNQDASAVLRPAQEEVAMLENLHLVLQVRACALIASGRNAEAAEDVLTGLRLAQLARQLTDARSTSRVQMMLTHSLQPLWEGLKEEAWTEPQLAEFQRTLADFNLLTDYTNAISRVVLAYIQVWREIPERPRSDAVLSALGSDYVLNSAAQLQPDAWWFDNCLQLYYAGQSLQQQVDVASGRIQVQMNWSSFNDLPIDAGSRELFQQSIWLGANPAVIAFVQTAVNQASIACALERFRLAKNAYPQALSELVPAFLGDVPHDAVSGRPMAYQFLAPDDFILRGVGPNGIDDRNKPFSDDWLWAYSTNSPNAKVSGSGK